MCREEYEAAIEAFVRSNGITRRPTANALSSQGSLAAADRAALQHYAECAASRAGNRSWRATGRSGPLRSWLGRVSNAFERSALRDPSMSDELPPPNTKRWVVRRKAAVITAVHRGRITLEEALQLYQLTEEEYRSWERAFEEHGLHGLRSTGLQQYPRPRRPRSRR